MKTYKYWHLCLALLLSIGCLSYAQNKATFELAEDEKLIEFTTDRFTLPNLHVTPDGKNIIFDVLGDIYQVPLEGGKAEVLLQDNNWKRAGKLSPDGETLTYVSDETGEFQVWTLNLKTREKKVYPTKETLHYPLYSFWDKDNNLIIPDKKGILSYNKNGEKTILRETKKDERSILNAIPQQISLDKKGEVAYIIKDSDFLAFNIKKKQETRIENTNLEEIKVIDFYRFNNSGKGFVGYKYDKNRVNILFYQSLEQNGVKNLIELESTGYSTNLHHSFDFINDTTIVLDKEGEIVQMDIKTGEYEPILIEVDIKKVIKKPLRREPQYIKDSIITASVLRNPITRPGLDTIYFGAFGKLHSFAKETGVITEIYPKEDRFEVSPSLSSDGSYLAYTTWNDTEMGHVYAREIKTGKEYQLTKEPGRYLNPVWASDRRSLVYLSDETLRTEGSLKAPPNSGHLMHLNEIKISKKKLRVTSINKIVEVVVVSPQPNRYFSPISYDKSENGVYILNKNLNRKGKKNIPELMHVDLKSRKFTSSTELPHNIDEALVSPDEKQVAFIHDNQIWINNYPFMPEYVFSENSDLISKVHHTYGGYVESVSLPQTAKSIYEIAPSYLFWKDKNTLMWGSAEEVYTYDVRTGKTQKIADIQVQKPRAVPKTQYALTNARIITMNKQDEIIEKGTILVKDNRIKAVGEKVKIPEDYKVFDLEGKTIMPGLIDVHAHYISDPHEMQFHNNYLLLSNLAYGVTSIYDPSVNTLDYRDISQMVETGQIIGPRIFASGNIIMDKPGQYDYKQIKNYQDAERIVLSFRKLRVSGPIKEYSISNRNKRQWLREAAEKHNYSITTDQVNYIPAITRVFDGYSSIEHLIGLFNIQKDVLRLISYSKIDYTPTLITKNFSSLIYGNPKWKDEYCNNRVLINGDNVYQTESEFLGGCLNLLKNSYLAKNEEREQFLKDQINLLKYIINNGGKVSVGAHGTYKAGINTHWELWAYTMTGLDNYKALKTATINGAEKLSLDKEIGSIEKGKLADLVILNSNPIDHIYNTADVDYTIINGKKYQVK